MLLIDVIAALDANTEKLVNQAIEDYCQQQTERVTRISVTHRLASAAPADRVTRSVCC